MATLYVSDLDGTLLNRNHEISAFSAGVIQNLIEKGLPFTYATARSFASARGVAAGITPRLPVIVNNGAFIVDSATGVPMFSAYFQEEEKMAVAGLLDRYRLYPLVYSHQDGAEKVSWIAAEENEGMRYYISQRKGDKRFQPLSSSERLYAGEVFYFTCIGEREKLLPVYEALRDHPHCQCLLQQELYRDEYWCEIMPKPATKANAILKLKEELGCTRVVCFGDGLNDLSMFAIADECYAVANAVEALKAAATGTIGANSEDGVALWLRQYATS
ncbi:HAD family hydrolase [Paenibacillus sp. YN15]|uniref:HAD family hydrolase n=1 Tax=Paenibacillus sp. YN15 TaxID=1742774 RepID=UPI000DCF2490|nr:HAD family hydrolase [Paenibacillus sp. YN15]RAU90953.1 HAD family hydrolase [Paenibacillus sp. YN15]